MPKELYKGMYRVTVDLPVTYYQDSTSLDFEWVDRTSLDDLDDVIHSHGGRIRESELINELKEGV